MNLSHKVVPAFFALLMAAVLLGPQTSLAGDGAPTDAADAAMATIHPEAIRADMRFLSDDSLEGRGTATRGHEIAAKFMATQFEALGLQPAGENGTYFQNVPLRSMRPDAAKSSLSFTRDGKEETPAFVRDYISFVDPSRAETTVEAPVIFVGYGVTAPQQKYDDYQGIDVKGKIVAMVYEAPNFESSIKAHYSSFEVKERIAAEHGAVGIIILDNPTLEKMYPFHEWVRDLALPQFRWLDSRGIPNDDFPQLKGGALLNMAATAKFFAGSGHNAEEIYAKVKAGKVTSFAMPFSAKIHSVTKMENAHSPNVVARLEGSDPLLKGECLVYSAHLDHLGIGEAVNGDSIYNGALDNASGSAMLLELARAFSGMNPRPKRSILFVAVTGEEAGLLGSDYFAHYPTVPKDTIVANINTDEDLMLWPMQDVIAFGAEHSSLAGVLQRAAARMHLTLSPDPLPDEVIFIRSDQYSFVKEGIPAMMPSPGFVSSNPNVDPIGIFQEWERTRYHQPQDDMDQPGLNFAAARNTRASFFCAAILWPMTHSARPGTEATFSAICTARNSVAAARRGVVQLLRV